MGERTIVECDGCGRTVEKKKSENWLRVEIDWGQGSEKIVVDSYACLRRYAERKELERAPDVS